MECAASVSCNWAFSDPAILRAELLPDNDSQPVPVLVLIPVRFRQSVLQPQPSDHSDAICIKHPDTYQNADAEPVTVPNSKFDLITDSNHLSVSHLKRYSQPDIFSDRKRDTIFQSDTVTYTYGFSQPGVFR